jgi:hypothetical protein
MRLARRVDEALAVKTFTKVCAHLDLQAVKESQTSVRNHRTLLITCFIHCDAIESVILRAKPACLLWSLLFCNSGGKTDGSNDNKMDGNNEGNTGSKLPRGYQVFGRLNGKSISRTRRRLLGHQGHPQALYDATAAFRHPTAASQCAKTVPSTQQPLGRCSPSWQPPSGCHDHECGFPGRDDGSPGSDGSSPGHGGGSLV